MNRIAWAIISVSISVKRFTVCQASGAIAPPPMIMVMCNLNPDVQEVATALSVSVFHHRFLCACALSEISHYSAKNNRKEQFFPHCTTSLLLTKQQHFTSILIRNAFINKSFAKKEAINSQRKIFAIKTTRSLGGNAKYMILHEKFNVFCISGMSVGRHEVTACSVVLCLANFFEICICKCALIFLAFIGCMLISL